MQSDNRGNRRRKKTFLRAIFTTISSIEGFGPGKIRRMFEHILLNYSMVCMNGLLEAYG